MWVRAIAVSLAVLVAGPALAAEPLFLVESGRMYLPPAPGTPVLTYQLRYSAETPWPGKDAITSDLRARAFPEAVTVVSVDDAAHIAIITTTRFGEESFVNVPAAVTPVGAQPPEPKCVSVFAMLALVKTPQTPEGGLNARAGAVCPFAAEVNPDRELIIEGLDAKGRRLFVTKSDDPRWSITESVSPTGQLAVQQMGRREAASIYVRFRAPVDDRLKTVRVWQIDNTGAARTLGDIAWTGVAIVP